MHTHFSAARLSRILSGEGECCLPSSFHVDKPFCPEAACVSLTIYHDPLTDVWRRDLWLWFPILSTSLCPTERPFPLPYPPHIKAREIPCRSCVLSLHPLATPNHVRFRVRARMPLTYHTRDTSFMLKNQDTPCFQPHPADPGIIFSRMELAPCPDQNSPSRSPTTPSPST